VKYLRVRAEPGKRIAITGINPVLLDCLQNVPGIVEQRDAPNVRKRLFPPPTSSDNAANRDWENLVVPDLRHLFDSAVEIMARDLESLTADPQHQHHFRIVFAEDHLAAWMSALNQARLVLGELFAVTEDDMRQTDLDMKQPKDLALFRIHVLGYLLQLLVEYATGLS